MFIAFPLRTLCACLFLVVMAVSAQAAVSAPPALPAEHKSSDNKLVSHKALYEISLAGTKSGSQVVNVSGKMLYETQASCDAWQASHQFNLFYEYADSPAMHVTSDFSTYEPFDGKSIDFNSRRTQDGQLVEELRGSATLKADGSGEAIYTMPKGLEYDLAPGSLFPMGHTLSVIKAIRDNKKFMNASVFDGSDEEGPIEISSFVGKPVLTPDHFKSDELFDQKLLASPAHSIRLAYFPLGESGESADYEMDVVFHENGIISDMAIEYDDFTVTQKLVALEALPDACPAKATGR